MLTRRQFIRFGGVAGAAALLSPRLGPASLFTSFAPQLAAQGIPLPGSAIPQFVDPLPLLSVAGGPLHTVIAGSDEIELHMREFQANVMPSTFIPATGPGTYTGTWAWGYIVGLDAPTAALGTYLGR